VINLVLVEHVFSVPGFFQRTWRATGHTDNPDWVFIDYPTLTGLAVWGSIFVVVLSFAMDVVILRLDPRVRAASGVGAALHVRR
jgi:ABC-type dipeptide/oligopeptide/nickel transport system permease component